MIIWANLDCEARWGKGSLPSAVARRVSAAATLLAAFASDDESVEIYTPAPVDPARIAIGNIALRVGAPAHYDLAWADPDAKAANDRRVALALNEQLETSLRAARVIASLAELDAHLAAIAPARWVCKAPWTAAGRDRAHGEGAPLTGELRTYVGRLIERFGVVLFEPWLDRVLDLGVCAHLARDGRVTTQPPHTLLVDARGGFYGIDLAEPALRPEDRELLARTAHAAGAALHCLDYAGPYTVDAFLYRDTGRVVLHPCCEINARYTFGHVTRALAARFGTQTLGFSATPPDGARVLVRATADDPTTAWIR